MNNNNTTASDNSSDSASNKKSTRTEIEIIDQKIIKCINEINTLEHKIQREWSKQMNAHLKNFYDDEVDKSHNNDSINSNNNQSFSTPQQAESTEYDKRKFLLHKKLKSYEKRRQKLLYESKKEQEASKQADSELKSDTASDTSNPISTLSNTTVPNASNLANSSNQNNAPSSNILKSSTRSDSFLINNGVQFKQSISDDQSKQNIIQSDDKNPQSYLNIDSNMSNIKFNNNLADNDNYQNEDNTSNQLYMVVLQQIMELKLQQEKIQSDLENIREKNNENYQMLLKELQSTSSQISEHTSKTMFGLYKTNDQKLDELKSLFDRSLQSYNYSINHCHRDIKETKEDVSYMKNKIEFIDKAQKIPNIETTPTNYWQLFYKLLDIFLTFLTIILLAFTNMIASVKFIFLLYPRTIVIFLLAYFVIFYIVDYERLKHEHFDQFKSFDTNSSSSVTRFLNSIYGLFFLFKNKIYPDANAVVS